MSDISEELHHADFADGFSDRIRFWFHLADVFLSISLHVDCVTEMELGLTFVLSSLVNKGFI